MEKLWNEFSFGLFFWQLFLFIALLLLLKKFAWKPILKSLNEREDGIKDAIKSAENAKKEMQNLQLNNKELLKKAKRERDLIMKEAGEIRDKLISDSKKQATVEASKIIEKAKISIEQEKQLAVNHLKKQVANLSINIAQKILKKELSSPNEQIKLVEEMLEEVTLN